MIFVIGFYLILVITLTLRNIATSNEKARILHIISTKCKEDIYTIPQKSWEWRYEQFDEVSYHLMVFQFWKPIKSYYKNHICIADWEELDEEYIKQIKEKSISIAV